MFKAVTRDIAVTVTPRFMPDESDPEANRYVWSYHVLIENDGRLAVQLLSRRWLITDAAGVVQEVEGSGVVGQQPVINPGARFDYTSGCPLSTTSGIMAGHYVMLTELGERFEVTIPAFSLDMPDVARVLN